MSKYINNSFWHIVIELLINLIDENQGDTEIIDQLIETQLDSNREAYAFFLSIIRSIKNVSNTLIKLIVKNSILLCINNLYYDDKVHRKNFIGKNKYSYNLFHNLVELLMLNEFTSIMQKCCDEIYEEITDDDFLIKFMIFVREINMVYPIKNGYRQRYKIKYNRYERINTLKYNNLYLFYIKCYDNRDDMTEIVEFINTFGIEELYRYKISYFWSGITRQPLIYALIINLVKNDEGIAMDVLKNLVIKGIDLKSFDRYTNRFNPVLKEKYKVLISSFLDKQ